LSFLFRGEEILGDERILHLIWRRITPSTTPRRAARPSLQGSEGTLKMVKASKMTTGWHSPTPTRRTAVPMRNVHSLQLLQSSPFGHENYAGCGPSPGPVRFSLSSLKGLASISDTCRAGPVQRDRLPRPRTIAVRLRPRLEAPAPPTQLAHRLIWPGAAM